MRTTELTDIECAYELIERVLRHAGDEGEHLVLAASAVAHASNVDQSLVQKRLAARKCLQSAKDLLGIAVQLMSPAEPRSAREASTRKRVMLEEVRLAARRTYEAGHLLVGVNLRD